MNNLIVTEKIVISKGITEETYSPYWDGFYAFMEGQPLEAMPTPDHVRGWKFALKCEAETVDYVEYQMEFEWARGGW